jgi:30S ribosomal protein S31
MGKGDKKTRRGKIYRGSYGKTRPKKRPGQRKAAAAKRRAAAAAAAASRGR